MYACASADYQAVVIGSPAIVLAVAQDGAGIIREIAPVLRPQPTGAGSLYPTLLTLGQDWPAAPALDTRSHSASNWIFPILRALRLLAVSATLRCVQAWRVVAPSVCSISGKV